MRRVRAAATAVVLSSLLFLPQASAELLSKTYVFKSAVVLELGIATSDGLRADTVRFELPASSGSRFQRPGGLVQAEVSVSNTASATLKVGVALALFDEGGRLVGVASGGTRVVGVKPGRQRSYKLVFDDVNAEAYRATTFQISLESKP